MCRSMIKRFLGLLLLSGCATSPVTVTGQLMPDYPPSLLNKGDQITLEVWFCNDEIDLTGSIANSKYSGIARHNIRKKADQYCTKAEVAEDGRSYLIKNLPPGRYEIAAIADSRHPPDLAIPDYRWWLFYERIYNNRTIHLTYENSYL